jgi:hypothetical protein
MFAAKRKHKRLKTGLPEPEFFSASGQTQTVAEQLFPQVLSSGFIIGNELTNLRCVAKPFATFLSASRCWPTPSIFRFGSPGRSLLGLRSVQATQIWIDDIYGTEGSLAGLDNLPVTFLNMRYSRKTTDGDMLNISTWPLERLNIGACTEITDLGIEQLQSMPLNTLIMTGCMRCTDYGIAHIGSLPLRELDISECYAITEVSLQYLSCTPLLNLNLAGCSAIQSVGYSFLPSSITALNLSRTGILDTGVCHLSKLHCLQKLNLNDTFITDVGMAYLSALPLYNLHLRSCINVTDAGIANLSSLPLGELDLGYNYITNAGVANLSSLPLRLLKLDKCGRITDECLLYLRGKNLIIFDLRGCAKISKAALIDYFPFALM